VQKLTGEIKNISVERILMQKQMKDVNKTFLTNKAAMDKLTVQQIVKNSEIDKLKEKNEEMNLRVNTLVREKTEVECKSPADNFLAYSGRSGQNSFR